MKAQLSQILMFPPKELPSLVIPLRASPWKYIPNVLRRLVAQNVARTVPMTHPPLVTTGPQTFAYSPPHSSPPLNWPKCTVLHTTKNELNLKRENLDLPPQSYTLYVFIMCEISTKRQEKRIYVNYVSLWCDQVVSGLLANNFLVPSFENISEK